MSIYFIEKSLPKFSLELKKKKKKKIEVGKGIGVVGIRWALGNGTSSLCPLRGKK